MTYSVKSQNATYRKRQEYGDLMNVVFVYNRSECTPSDEYCGLWNEAGLSYDYDTRRGSLRVRINQLEDYTKNKELIDEIVALSVANKS